MLTSRVFDTTAQPNKDVACSRRPATQPPSHYAHPTHPPKTSSNPEKKTQHATARDTQSLRCNLGSILQNTWPLTEQTGSLWQTSECCHHLRLPLLIAQGMLPTAASGKPRRKPCTVLCQGGTCRANKRKRAPCRMSWARHDSASLPIVGCQVGANRFGLCR